MDNTTSILHIWLNGIRSGKQGCVIENRQVDLEPSRVPRLNLGASPDRVVEDAAIRAPRVTEDRNPDRDRADRDHDRANPDRDRIARIHDHIVRGRGLEIALDRATAENLQVDPSRGEEQGQDRTLRRSARTTNLADQSQVLEHVALSPDENRDPEVAPSLVIRIVTGGAGAAIDRLPSKSRGQDHDLHHPDGDHAAVLGLCQSRQVVEVVLGRELPP